MDDIYMEIEKLIDLAVEIRIADKRIIEGINDCSRLMNNATKEWKSTISVELITKYSQSYINMVEYIEAIKNFSDFVEGSARIMKAVDDKIAEMSKLDNESAFL